MCRNTLVVKVKRVHSGQREAIPVPCGTCPRCISSKILAWQFRLSQELKVSYSPFFVTLTYNARHLPKKEIEIIDYTTGEIKKSVFVPTLEPKHVSDYIKRLRFAYREKYSKMHHPVGCKCKNCPSIRYYLCGEYGSRHKRPHYHIILLNCHDEELIERSWGLKDKKDNRYRPFGFVHCSPLQSIDSISYTLKYCYKQAQPKGVQGLKPFSRMSKGIGRNYITHGTIEYHYRGVEFNNVNYLGKKIPMPKYFKEKIFDPDYRFHVSRYLQKLSENSEQIRAEKVARNQCRTVDEVLLDIYNEQFSEKFLQRRFELH